MLLCLALAGVSPTAAFLVDHTTRTYYDLYRERKAHLKGVDQEVGCRPWGPLPFPPSVHPVCPAGATPHLRWQFASAISCAPRLLCLLPSQQVADMLAEGAGKARVGESEFDFRPVRTWFGRQSREKVEGWETEVRQQHASAWGRSMLAVCFWRLFCPRLGAVYAASCATHHCLPLALVPVCRCSRPLAPSPPTRGARCPSISPRPAPLSSTWRWSCRLMRWQSCWRSWGQAPLRASRCVEQLLC